MHGAIPPFPQYAFMVWCLVKHRDNFTFTLHSSPLVGHHSTTREWPPDQLLCVVGGNMVFATVLY
jgi:hypothetical protein